MLRSRLLWQFVFVAALVSAVVIAHNLVLLWQADRPQADLDVILWQTIALGLLTVIAVLLVSVVHLGFIRHSLRRLQRGVQKVRTLLARDNALVLAFFRSQGMMAAPFIALERDL